MSDNLVNEAYKIAASDLRSNYGKLAIYAGPKNHHEYWARDSFFASLGACSLRDFDTVRKNLDLFIKYQREDGQIPLRVEERNHGLNYLGIKIFYKFPIPRFRASQPWASEVVDTSALFIISALDFVKRSKDRIWLQKNLKSLNRVAEWFLSRKNRFNLIDEGLTASWADMTLKSGSVTYTNVCVWKALRDLSEFTPFLNKEAKKLSEAIDLNLWSEKKGYFVDWISRNGAVYDDFFVDGNLLAIVWGLANKDRSEKILDFISDHSLNKIPVITSYPNLAWWMDIFIKIVFPEYHTNNIFAWWGPFEALARFKTGDKKGAVRSIRALAKLIIKNRSVVEVVNQQGDPIELPWYKAERQIAWGAGVFVYTLDQLRG